MVTREAAHIAYCPRPYSAAGLAWSQACHRIHLSEGVHGNGSSPKTGHYVINPQFGLAHSFSDGLAAVRIGSKWGYIAR